MDIIEILVSQRFPHPALITLPSCSGAEPDAAKHAKQQACGQARATKETQQGERTSSRMTSPGLDTNAAAEYTRRRSDVVRELAFSANRSTRPNCAVHARNDKRAGLTVHRKCAKQYGFAL